MELEMEESSNREFNYFGPSSRTLLLNKEITVDSASLLVDDLLFATSESNEPIQLLINSPGGDVYSTIMIMDAIRSIEPIVIGIASGLAGSGAFYVLQSCDIRTITPYSYLFWHQVISYEQEVKDRAQMDKWVKRYEALNKNLEEFFKKRARISVSNWRKHFIEDNDVYFNAEEAKALNLVDEITEPVKKYKNFKK